MQSLNGQQGEVRRSGFKRIRGLSWDDIFKRSVEELGREPGSHEVQGRILEMLNCDPYEHFEWS